MIHSPVAWSIFGILVLGMLAIDLGVFHRRPHAETFREALAWSAVWILLALMFNLGVAVAFGPQKGVEFLTAYLIEKSLSVDNIFVFVAIFSYFSVKPAFQHGVLFWGILGALLMRGLFIWTGLALIGQFHWVTYVMGGFLVLTGFKLCRGEGTEVDPENNPIVRLVRKFLPFSSHRHDHSFFVKEGKRFLATPLFLVLVVVEMTDVIFAVDSVPAVLAISQDPFIAYTSNVFAILGLRALYFVLAGVIPRFVYLRYGLCAVLVFVGVKMLLAGVCKIPIGLSLAVIAFFLLVAVGISLWKTGKRVL